MSRNVTSRFADHAHSELIAEIGHIKCEALDQQRLSRPINPEHSGVAREIPVYDQG